LFHLFSSRERWTAADEAVNCWRVIAVAAAMPLLSACDPVTYGEVVIASEDRIDTTCLSKVEEQLRTRSGVEVVGSIAGTRGVVVRRGSDDISVVLESSTPTRITLSFKWLGRSPAADERGEFQLLDELQALVTRECTLTGATLTVQRRCSARLCNNWLGDTGDSSER
jgi:hypothetical protein